MRCRMDNVLFIVRVLGGISFQVQFSHSVSDLAAQSLSGMYPGFPPSVVLYAYNIYYFSFLL
jgi:hypothetical protein